MQRTILLTLLLVVVQHVQNVHAGEVLFNNGDRLTGKVTNMGGGKLKVSGTVAGDIIVDLKDVKTFSSDDEMTIRMKDNSVVHEKVATTTGPTTQAVEVKGKEVPFDQIKRMGGKSTWTGTVIASGNLERGNTHSEDFGLAANAQLRRDDEFHDDRFTLGASYNFGKQTVNGDNTTSADNWMALVKYDKFFTEKWYGYGMLQYWHDRLADLQFRLTPGVGVGYQWIETPTFNLNTEAGVSYVYEEFSNDGNNDRVALRLAYHVDKALNDKIGVFHNFEWLPAFDDPSDYNLNADVGIQAKITGKLISQFKIVYQRDTTPAPGADENDVRFQLGVGYSF
jgi:putative salt-induced outer membrane protein YdiY